MEILFRSALIPRGGRLVARDVVVEGGVVARVTGPGSISPVGRTGGGPACHGSTGGFDNAAGRAAGIIEAEGRVLVPAFVDPHVHVREPGFDHKEDWETCSKAALKGGASCIFDMPNNKIPVNRYGLLLEKKAIAIRKS
jgi:dihydroorotase